MKYIAIIVVASTTLLLGTASAEQNNANNNSENKPQQQMTIIGCLSKTANTYVITGGTQPQEFRITSGNTSMLQGEVGQSVEVVGMIGTASPREASGQPYNEGTTTGVLYETIALQKAKVLGGDCSIPGQEWKGDHLK